MASSGKTSKLGLSLWEETDKPERLDFRQDNEKVESVVGGHIADYMLHLTSTEKAFVRQPVSVTTYQGNGAAARTFNFDFRPDLILVYAQNSPPFRVVNGVVELYSAAGHYLRSCTAGLRCDRYGYTVYQQAEGTSTNGARNCLNESGKTYTVILVQ